MKWQKLLLEEVIWLKELMQLGKKFKSILALVKVLQVVLLELKLSINRVPHQIRQKVRATSMVIQNLLQINIQTRLIYQLKISQDHKVRVFKPFKHHLAF